MAGHREHRELRVWAPAAGRVEVVLGDERLPMTRDGEEWVARTDAPDGTAYSFSLDGGPSRPDPRGLRLPDGPHGPSALYDPDAFAWTDHGWRGVPLEGAVLYELHVGTFTPEGTLDAAVKRLGHLADLGISVVELMPVAPFPGRHGWGYDGVAPYAVHEPYGGPEALQRFVDAAHGLGLGVCLDVVHNHLGPDGNYLPEFGPYLTSTHHTPWGAALNLDAPGSDAVRRWVLDNVRQWLRDFHVDGLRLDAVHELHDDRAVHLLEEMSGEVDALAAETGRHLWLVAESDRNDPRTVTPRGEGDAVGGLGVHGQWADDVHHALHVALTGETQGYYADFADPSAPAKVMRSPFFHDGTHSSFRGRTHGRPVDVDTVPGWRFVASLQTHDQVGNRATGDRLSASVEPGLLAAGAAVLLTSPWTPMLFMGEEWGAGTPWQYFTDHQDPTLAEAVRQGRGSEFGSHGWVFDDVPDPQDPATVTRSTLDWEETTREPHARLLRWYTDLLRLRREHRDLRDSDLRRVEADWDAGSRRLLVRRGDHEVLANLGGEPWVHETAGTVLLSWDEGVVVAEGRVVVPPCSAAVVAPDPRAV
jgi:maltooligosyltrehalose trehalohydrolase